MLSNDIESGKLNVDEEYEIKQHVKIQEAYKNTLYTLIFLFPLAVYSLWMVIFIFNVAEVIDLGYGFMITYLAISAVSIVGILSLLTRRTLLVNIWIIGGLVQLIYAIVNMLMYGKIDLSETDPDADDPENDPNAKYVIPYTSILLFLVSFGVGMSIKRSLGKD
mmetsp:Transcript_6889/g.6181  ORF Transcript_6889/g.6181 Transcript_6889/m.6181 type:complete len:164 (+) Transcript_6889:81-572(+)|eukprot:CAMPEP_0114581530 /NCGR_PEP_ID=MMETSP0125-20121206/5631_1 /TAXON_ID=485358 ORGANISM="Aristerostoma sp., Strain ATCC 50986" /NCGR_SAMPLE_ID=MMETSP0125 /ASSEMBLY_ACC=CAM_ASM_000245 /LENGTH=163 /DNA_ID=CAMNT_0001773815 /DNA_START=30 /DNA_END=521 /DNA_ORIENTATION=+